MIICKCFLRIISLEIKNKMSMIDWKDGDKEIVFVLYEEFGISLEIFFFIWYGLR